MNTLDENHNLPAGDDRPIWEREGEPLIPIWERREAERITRKKDQGEANQSTMLVPSSTDLLAKFTVQELLAEIGRRVQTADVK